MLQVSCCAPKSKFRVIGDNTSDGSRWVSGDFKTLKGAKKHADKKCDRISRQIIRMHVYDDKGHHVYWADTN